jgi:hypothetical protein
MMPGKEVVKKVKSMFFSSYMNSCIEKGENKETCELNFFFLATEKKVKILQVEILFVSVFI